MQRNFLLCSEIAIRRYAEYEHKTKHLQTVDNIHNGKDCSLCKNLVKIKLSLKCKKRNKFIFTTKQCCHDYEDRQQLT